MFSAMWVGKWSYNVSMSRRRVFIGCSRLPRAPKQCLICAVARFNLQSPPLPPPPHGASFSTFYIYIHKVLSRFLATLRPTTAAAAIWPTPIFARFRKHLDAPPFVSHGIIPTLSGHVAAYNSQQRCCICACVCTCLAFPNPGIALMPSPRAFCQTPLACRICTSLFRSHRRLSRFS